MSLYFNLLFCVLGEVTPTVRSAPQHASENRKSVEIETEETPRAAGSRLALVVGVCNSLGLLVIAAILVLTLFFLRRKYLHVLKLNNCHLIVPLKV